MILASLLIILMLAAAYDTPVRRMLSSFTGSLNRYLPKTNGGRLALAIAVVVVTVGLFKLLQTEAFGIAGPMAPEIATWFAVLDVGTAMDVFAVAIVAVLSVRLKVVSQVLRTAVTIMVRLARSGRRQRAKTSRRRLGQSSEDDERWVQGLAFC